MDNIFVFKPKNIREICPICKKEMKYNYGKSEQDINISFFVCINKNCNNYNMPVLIREV